LAGPGAVKKKGWLLRYELKKLFAAQLSILFFPSLGLEPDGCLVADQIRIRTKTIEKPGCRLRKGAVPTLDCVPAKKIVLFCDVEVFFIDRGLLMDAKISNQISNYFR